VAAGDRLGLVGLSGNTEFPHVHLSLRRDGQPVDPFDPDGQITCGAPDAVTLWAPPLAYQPGALLDAGFATAIPDYAAIKAGTAAAETMATNAPALVVWGYAFGGRAGDVLHLQITGPGGHGDGSSRQAGQRSGAVFPRSWPQDTAGWLACGHLFRQYHPAARGSDHQHPKHRDRAGVIISR